MAFFDNGIILIPFPVGTKVNIKKRYAWEGEGDLIPYEITNISISCNKNGVWTKKYRAMRLVNGKIVDDQCNFNFEDIGRVVFAVNESE